MSSSNFSIIGNPNRERKSKILGKEFVDELNKRYSDKNIDEDTKDLSPSVHSQFDFWAIKNVLYRGEFKDYDLMKSLSNPKTQADYAKGYLKTRMNNEKNFFHCADMPLFYSIFRTIYHSKDSEQKEEARAFIQKSMTENYIITLTRVFYSHKKNLLDKIVHNYGISDEEYFRETNFVGQNNKDLTLDNKNILEALLLTDNVSEVRAVFNWINQAPALILITIPGIERKSEVALFNTASSNNTYIHCVYDSKYPSFGVRLSQS